MAAPRDPKPIDPENLASAQDAFIAAWGQMGSTWGISRTMAEIFALLYITGAPLNTDEVMDRLRISRGNASMSLRALLDWGIVSKVHKRGDRKEYFEAQQDVYALSRAVVRERLRREIHPILASLFEIRDLTADEQRTAGDVRPEDVEAHNRRLDQLLQLTEMIDKIGQRFVEAEGKGLRAAANLLSKVV